MLKTIYHNSRNDAREAVKNGWGDKVIDNGTESEDGKRWSTVIEIDEPGSHTIPAKDLKGFAMHKAFEQSLSEYYTEQDKLIGNRTNARILVSRNKREGNYKIGRAHV